MFSVIPYLERLKSDLLEQAGLHYTCRARLDISQRGGMRGRPPVPGEVGVAETLGHASYHTLREMPHGPLPI